MQNDEHHQEAARLMELPPAERERIVALIRSPAEDLDVPEEDRRVARERADALESELRRLFWRGIAALDSPRRPADG